MADNQFLINPNLIFQVFNEGLTKDRVDRIVSCDFKGKDDLIRFYLAYDGVFFNEGAVISTEQFLKDDEDEYYELEIESIFRIDQIQNIWEAIKEHSAGAKKFMETNIPFAGDAGGNHFFIEIPTGEIKYVFWEYDLEEGLIWVAPGFKDFCLAIKPMG